MQRIQTSEFRDTSWYSAHTTVGWYVSVASALRASACYTQLLSSGDNSLRVLYTACLRNNIPVHTKTTRARHPMAYGISHPLPPSTPLLLVHYLYLTADHLISVSLHRSFALPFVSLCTIRPSLHFPQTHPSISTEVPVRWKRQAGILLPLIMPLY